MPAITVLFWVTKLLTTAMGKAAAAYLAAVSIGLAAVVATAGFALAMVLQVRSRAYRAEVRRGTLKSRFESGRGFGDL